MVAAPRFCAGLDERVAQREPAARDHRGDYLAVGRRGKAWLKLGTERVGVDQIAVVPERHRPDRAVVDEWLGVLPRVRTGGRIAGVADRELAGEPCEFPLAEHLSNETEVSESGQPTLVGDRDPG